MSRMHRVVIGLTFLLFAQHLPWTAEREVLPTQPNFVLILTDDQDTLGSTDKKFAPNLDKYLRQEGVEFKNFYVHTPVCCPGRTSYLRAQYAHNHNVTHVRPPFGGFTKFMDMGLDNNYLPLWLEELGYANYYTGKFLVWYDITNYKRVPRGYKIFEPLVYPWTFRFDYPVTARNGQDPVTYPGQYSTDVIGEKTLAYIRDAAKHKKPFFVTFAPIAPHDSVEFTNYSKSPVDGTLVGDSFGFPPIPANRHWNWFVDEVLPRTPNFNEADVSDKPAWLRNLPQIQQKNLTFLDEYWRLRVRSLAAVDEYIGKIVDTLQAVGELDNTYIIYTSDNGYHIGNHRLPAGKNTAFEEDIHVPFFIRGPGLKPGVSFKTTGAIDLAPTLVKLAGGSLREHIDGSPIPLDEFWTSTPSPRGYPSVAPREHSLIEYWNQYNDAIEPTTWFASRFNYKGVRVQGAGYAYKFVRYAIYGTELYNLSADPSELDNIATHLQSIESGRKLLSRLDALVSALGFAWGKYAQNPWLTIHGENTTVGSLQDALDSQYDDFYASLAPYSWKAAIPTYQVDNEDSPFKAQLLASRPLDSVINAPPEGRRLLSETYELLHSRRLQAATIAEEYEAPAVDELATPLPQELLTLKLAPRHYIMDD